LGTVQERCAPGIRDHGSEPLHRRRYCQEASVVQIIENAGNVCNEERSLGNPVKVLLPGSSLGRLQISVAFADDFLRIQKPLV
jgi:hypothetical protein